MAYDYNRYVREYNKKNIACITLKLHRVHDADILEAIDEENKQKSIKELIRTAIASGDHIPRID